MLNRYIPNTVTHSLRVSLGDKEIYLWSKAAACATTNCERVRYWLQEADVWCPRIWIFEIEASKLSNLCPKNWVFEANFAKLGQVGTNIMAFTPDICINHNMI